VLLSPPDFACVFFYVDLAFFKVIIGLNTLLPSRSYFFEGSFQYILR
jgi:hypothetical protein